MTQKQPIKDLQAPLKELHKMFEIANKELYDNKLPDVVLTIQSGGKRNSMGWFTVNPAWVLGDDSELHEINLSSEFLKGDFFEIADTLLHEMIHLHCHFNKIKDTSRGGTYHNKNFRKQAELHGMEYKHDKPDAKIGYSNVSLTPETIKQIESWDIDKEVFQLARKMFGSSAGEKKPSNIIKWTCPSCGDVVRSSKPSVKMVCFNDDEGSREPCMAWFEKEL